MITITFNTRNDAFQAGGLNAEVARLLRELAEKIEQGDTPTQLRTANGDTVGLVEYLEE